MDVSGRWALKNKQINRERGKKKTKQILMKPSTSNLGLRRCKWNFLLCCVGQKVGWVFLKDVTENPKTSDQPNNYELWTDLSQLTFSWLLKQAWIGKQQLGPKSRTSSPLTGTLQWARGIHLRRTSLKCKVASLSGRNSNKLGYTVNNDSRKNVLKL